MPGEIQQALTSANVNPRDLDLLVVASGPGAFTGLRIGLATIQGLAMALDLPVTGGSALDALALAARRDPRARECETIVAWMDAARGEVFSGRYDGVSGTMPPWRDAHEASVGPPNDILASLPETLRSRVAFVGDGAVRYRAQIAAWSAGATVIDPPGALAPALVDLGRLQAAAGAAGPPHALQPLYVRRPDAELERARRRTS
jgi:tRNA threonylcarbamoyladenosine biosynthesis protein TsaB